MKIGIVGYGKMGSGIFKLLAGKDFDITVYVRKEERRRKYEDKYLKGLERACKRGRITREQLEEKKSRIQFTSDYKDLEDSDLVIETAVEDFDQKSLIFAKLEEVTGRDSVLVTNTSSISIGKLARSFRYPDRFCGFHFFYPIPLINLVEIVKASNTSPETIDFLKDLSARIGKLSITVRDAPGSVINAILAYYYAEALYLLEEGWLPPSRIDELAKRYFYVGPCESIDVIGVDFFVHALQIGSTPEGLCPIVLDREVGEISPEAVGGREGFHVPRLLPKLIAENRLGRKVSRGIFLYDREKPVDDILEFYRDPDRANPGQAQQDEELAAMRLLYAVFNGTLFSLYKQMATPEDLDTGVREILQMEVGPLSMIKMWGVEEVRKNFEFLESRVGKRFSQKGLELLEP